MPNTDYPAYEERKARLSDQMQKIQHVRLDKATSNLFRSRERISGAKIAQNKLSVRDFNHVLSVNIEERWADIEGMTTYEDFVDETLKHGLMPAVVPQLKTITIGGAVSGVGIESTSFRYGLVHETVIEMEILLASGEIMLCNKDKNADLFYGFPNSYGTFGYVLRLRVKLLPVQRFVKLEHKKFTDRILYLQDLERACTSNAPRVDFVDGTIFASDEMYITTGTFTNDAPYTSDYTYMNVYYQSIRKRNEDYLPVRDYLWRWDTDWFWCSKAIHAQNPIIRRLLGKKRLNSNFYTKAMRMNDRLGITTKFSALFGGRREWIIQDVDIPIENAPAFAEFFFQNIGIRPIWICPIGSYDKTIKFPLYPLDPKKLYVNFGFWDSVLTDKEPGHYNRLVEAKVSELHGRKGLYSDSFYTPEEFWRVYDKAAYDVLKERYDPEHKLKNLFEKSIQKK